MRFLLFIATRTLLGISSSVAARSRKLDTFFLTWFRASETRTLFSESERGISYGQNCLSPRPIKATYNDTQQELMLLDF